MKRRHFLASLGAMGLAACQGKPAAPVAPGKLLGASPDIGHLLRQSGLPAPSETRSIPVLIVGAGIGGLSAGWKLAKSGFDGFALLELETEAGGNSRSCANPVSPCPLGAHYLPLPTQEATAVRELLAELGVLHGDPRAARPRYDERYLCAAPQERLYRHGLWQESVLPLVGIGAAERAEYRRFFERMAQLRQARDSQGRRAFAIPMALSSPEPAWLALDKLTMADWLRREGFNSPHLHWYVDYTCRDDYGTRADATSAWAGIHYFACRNGEAQDAASDVVLTTAGGNGWLADGLAARCRDKIRTGALVWRIEQVGKTMQVDVWLTAEQRSLRFLTRQVIWAGPVFALPRLLAGFDAIKQAAGQFSHAPWLLANLTLDALPETRAGFPLAWDNVLHDSPGLGYVVATHQRLRLAKGPTVITYYRALATGTPQANRQWLLSRSREELAGEVLRDLARPHPEIHELTRQIDLIRHGHAMSRPLPGLVHGAARQTIATGQPGLLFAHADASGFSLFEEAQYRGVLAAEQTMARLGHAFRTSLR